MYLTETISGTLGNENGFGGGVFYGDYRGDGDPNIQSFYGNSLNISAPGTDGGFLWGSVDIAHNQIPWRGAGFIVGISGIGLQWGTTSILQFW